MSAQRPLVVPACVRDAARDSAGVEAVVDGDQRLTFAELSDRVDEFARALVTAGVEPGERVGLWAPNSARWVVAALGALAAGAVLVPLNTRYKGAEALWVLHKSRAAALLVDDGFLGNGYVQMLRDADAVDGAPAGAGPVASLGALRVVVSWGSRVDPGVTPWDRFLAGAADTDISVVDGRIADLDENSLCDLVFTSGTTGRPKGVMTTHAANVRTSEAWGVGVGLRAGDRYVVVNPLFHSFGYRAGLMACVLLRATMYPFATFDADATITLASAERVTVFPGPPALFHSILSHPHLPDLDLSALRLVVTGASTVPAALMLRIREELGVEHVVSPYGLTEVAGTATICPIGTDLETLVTSVGTAIPDTEVAVVDENGHHLPAGTPGEIVVRGYNVMVGYFEDPEATAEAIDPDGWLHTGDVGELDERGYLRVTGRIKDVFQTGGFNVYPVEVEQLLITHPDVLDAAVIGVPDDRLGEVAHAFVVPAPGRTPDPDDVIAFARERIANFKVPRFVSVVDDLPRNALGKVQKFRLAPPPPEGASAADVPSQTVPSHTRSSHV